MKREGKNEDKKGKKRRIKEIRWKRYEERDREKKTMIITYDIAEKRKRESHAKRGLM